MKIINYLFKEDVSYSFCSNYHYDSRFKMYLLHIFYPFTWSFIKISRIYRNTVIGIKNLIYWLPVIWNNRWWDNWFFEKIIIHQLQYMHDNWDKSNHISYKNDKKSIESCLNTMKRINEDEYHEKMFEIGDVVEEKEDDSGKITREWNPDYKICWNDGKKVAPHELSFPYYEKQRDLEVFCRCLKENLFKWWD